MDTKSRNLPEARDSVGRVRTTNRRELTTVGSASGTHNHYPWPPLGPDLSGHRCVLRMGIQHTQRESVAYN